MKHFVDTAAITVKAGDGGDGIVSFRHEKYVPKGGPDGGDGGKGGNIYVIADNNLSTLLDFQQKKQYKADNGEPGGKQNMTGAGAEDMYLKVPVGTMVWGIGDNKQETAASEEHVSTNYLIADLSQVGDTTLVAQGGIGGKGNTRFKSSTNRTPRECTPGEKGQEQTLRLELKLLADVGFIGFPNAGKSTLLSVLTNARPEIQSYRFTTLHPNLGVMEVYGKEILLADIPGLIEGAAEGKGLGDEFLRHVERTRVLVHLIDPVSAAVELGQELSSDTVMQAYEVIRDELRDYSQALLEKPELIVISKIDIPENAAIVDSIVDAFVSKEKEVVGLSAAAHSNLEELKQKIVQLIEQAPEPEKPEPSIPVFGIEDL